MFQCELLYGGLFQLTGVPDDELEPVLLIECPRYLFPFARRIIADLSVEAASRPSCSTRSTSPASTPAQGQQAQPGPSPVGHA